MANCVVQDAYPWIVRGALKPEAFIDGEWVGADSAARFAVNNSADGSLLAEVPDLSAIETRRAIDAANEAWADWRDRTAKDRSIMLRRWFDLIIAHQQELAQLMTLEQGKPLAEARGEVSYGASFVEWFAEEAKRVYGGVIPSPLADRLPGGGQAQAF